MPSVKLYYKNPTTGKVTPNDVSPIDVSYWKSQGWTDTPPAPGITPAPVAPPKSGTPSAVPSPSSVPAAIPAVPDSVPVAPPPPVEQAAPPSSGQGIKVSQPGAPTLIERVISTPGSLIANDAYVQGVVKAITGTPATKEQLAQYVGKSVDEVKKGLIPASLLGNKIDVTKPVEISNLGGTVPPPPPAKIDSDESFRDSFVNFVRDLLPKMTTAFSQQSKAEKSLEGREGELEKLYAKAGILGERQLALEEKFKVPEFMQKAEEKALEIQQRVAEYDELQTRVQGQPGVVSSLITGEVAQLQRQKASDIAVLSAQHALLQGRFTTATSLVDRALKIEFGDLERQIDITKEFINLNEKTVDREDKRKMDMLSLITNYEKELLDQQKADRDQNYKLMIEVAKQGGDPDVIDVTADPSENLKAAAPFIAQSAVEFKIIDDEIKGVKKLIGYNAKGEIVRETVLGGIKAKGGAGDGGDGGKVTPELLAEAQAWARIIKDNPNYDIESVPLKPEGLRTQAMLELEKLVATEKMTDVSQDKVEDTYIENTKQGISLQEQIESIHVNPTIRNKEQAIKWMVARAQTPVYKNISEKEIIEKGKEILPKFGEAFGGASEEIFGAPARAAVNFFDKLFAK